MTWDTLDWAVLDRLRTIFLAENLRPVDYWRSRADLVNYDFTYAQRIGWKWDAVLGELARQGWRPAGDTVLDWGCGSGIAGRRVREFFGLRTLRVFDRSRLAMEFAAETGPAEIWRDAGGPVGTLVLSHVLNELPELEYTALLELIRRADTVLWVEPGTHPVSRALVVAREALRGSFNVIAPCTHAASCGLLTAENTRHWCHFFAAPPTGIMANGNWVRFAQQAGIDLRSLPYSYLVLDRRALPEPTPAARVIGTPRFYKGYAKVLTCRPAGVHDFMVQKRDAPALFKQLRDGERTWLNQTEQLLVESRPLP